MDTAFMKDRIVPIVSIVVIALFGAAYYYVYWMRAEEPVREPEPAPVVEPTPPPKAEPEVRHPLPSATTEGMKPLPPLAESDGMAQETAEGVVGKDSFARYFLPDSLIRRIVV